MKPAAIMSLLFLSLMMVGIILYTILSAPI
jgi:hypothetical protein